MQVRCPIQTIINKRIHDLIKTSLSDLEQSLLNSIEII